MEDADLSPIERTRRIISGSMSGIEEFLTFTTETEEDFSDGWLPTLDTAIRVSEDNKILFKFWEKPTNSNRTLDRRTAMGENQKLQVLTQEVIRRLGNTYEGLVNEDYTRIIDDFCQKLFNSGYKEDQIRRIIVAGIKGWGGKIRRCEEEGRRLRRTAKNSQEQRMRTKLIGKSSWFKRKGGRKVDWYGMKDGQNGGGRKGKVRRKVNTTTTPKSILFVDQTPGGELACRMRELFTRIEPTIGFHLKVVERTGLSLQSQFPLTTLWDGAPCGREGECITCYQGAERFPNCTQQSVVYENVCSQCVPSATGNKELKEEELQGDKPVLYVGETSRSIAERSKEHWALYKKRGEDSHMVKHQDIVHGGEQADFTMRVVGSFKSALGRQVSEAIRIRRRGGLGNILNSKSEYNRCHIARLRVEDEKEEEEREQETRREQEQIDTLLVKEQEDWKRAKTRNRDEERRETLNRIKKKRTGYEGARNQKRIKEGSKEAPSKRRRFALIEEDWGELQTTTAGEPQLSPVEQYSIHHPWSSSTVEHTTGEQTIPTTPSSRSPEVEEGCDTTAITLLREHSLIQQDIKNFLLPVRQEDRADIWLGGITNNEMDQEGCLGGCGYDIDRGGEYTRNKEDILGVPPVYIQDISGTEGCITNLNKGISTTPSLGENITTGEIICNDDLPSMDNDEEQREGVQHEDAQSYGVLDGGVPSMLNDVCNNEDNECEKKPRECEFTKKGMCIEHNIKGDALKTKRKVWRKKKHGYGWVTTTSVTYRCSMEGTCDAVSSRPDRDVMSHTPPLANSKGTQIVLGVSIGGQVGRD